MGFSRWRLLNQSAAIKAIAPKIAFDRDTLRHWVQEEETDAGRRHGVTLEERAKIKDLEREARELGQADEILKKASACFARAELDRPLKR